MLRLERRVARTEQVPLGLVHLLARIERGWLYGMVPRARWGPSRVLVYVEERGREYFPVASNYDRWSEVHPYLGR